MLNNNKNNNLQRMIIVHPDVFEKYSHIFQEDSFLSELDKRMRKILLNKHLNQIDKWHQYRENLLKFSFSKQANNNNFENFKSHATTVPILSENSTQTFQIPKFHKESQTLASLHEKQEKINKESQTMEYFNNNKLTRNREEVYESLHSDVDSDSEEIDMNDEIRERALEGVDRDVKITRELSSMDPTSYKLFELSNDDVVNVPTKRLTRLMLKNSGKSLVQSKLEFKKVKKNSNRSISHSKTRTQEPILNWDTYK